jgi:ligand-binding SRPBCC domain-containing protein
MVIGNRRQSNYQLPITNYPSFAMNQFQYQFTVSAPVTAVAQFHKDTTILKKLSPPPIFVQIHAFEPLAEGSKADFTMWFGPLPLRWLAVHSDVDPRHGFTDTQQTGPLAFWQHTHRFTAVDETTTLVTESIQYRHDRGRRGLLSRLLFNRPGLFLLFSYRKWRTRWECRRR